jgi:CheY-like chemotaxis protein
MVIKVLWVEEEPNSLRFERILAQQHGWQITSVETVSDASRLLNDERFDLVIVDLILPLDEFRKARGHVDPDAGLGLVDSIRNSARMGRTPATVPLLVVSAVVSPDRKARVVAKLTTERYYLNKPVDESAYRSILMELTAMLSQTA